MHLNIDWLFFYSSFRSDIRLIFETESVCQCRSPVSDDGSDMKANETVRSSKTIIESAYWTDYHIGKTPIAILIRI